jgi:hypothetical protein
LANLEGPLKRNISLTVVLATHSSLTTDGSNVTARIQN